MKKENKQIVIGIVIGIAILLVIWVGGSFLHQQVMDKHAEIRKELDSMNCDTLLEEIKKDNRQKITVGLLDTWVEKECWK